MVSDNLIIFQSAVASWSLLQPAGWLFHIRCPIPLR